MSYDLVVVGAGPGGYPGALVAAEKGANVLVVEENRPGGECVLYGCVPSKALLRAAAAVEAIRGLGGEARLPWRDAVAEARRLAERLSSGVEMLLSRKRIRVEKAHARMESPGGVIIGSEPLEAGSVLLAPGGEPSHPPGLEPDGSLVVDNRSLWMLGEMPENVLVIGGGPVGVELAQALAILGSRVVLVEAMDRLLPGLSPELGRYAARLLRRLGVKVRTGCPIRDVKRHGSSLEANVCGERLSFGLAVVATGRRSRAPEALAGEAAEKLLGPKGFIERRPGSVETLVPRVYAAGDAAGPPMLAHKAIHESIAAGLAAAGYGEAHAPSPEEIPTVVYGVVELAQAGYTSREEAEARGYRAAETRIRLGGVAYAAISHAEDGFVKIIHDADTGRLLGIVAAAPHASDIVAQALLAMKTGLGIEEASRIIHPHPSASEALAEALLAATGTPIHYLVKR